jgi:arginase
MLLGQTNFRVPKTMLLATALYRSFKPNLKIFKAPVHVGQKIRGVEKAPRVLIDELNLVSRLYKSNEYDYIQVFNVASPVNFLKQDIIDHASGDDVVLSIGGDHLTEYYSIAAQLERFGNESLGVIWVDTHCDINTKNTSVSGSQHGMVVAGLLGLEKNMIGNGVIKEKLLASNIVYVGARDIDPPELEIIEALGIKVYTSKDIHEQGVSAVMERVLYDDLSHVNKIHMSFDVDVIDPVLFPCTGTPVPGGLSHGQTTQLTQMVRDDRRLVSMGLVEFNPDIESEHAVMCGNISNNIIMSSLTYNG